MRKQPKTCREWVVENYDPNEDREDFILRCMKETGLRRPTCRRNIHAYLMRHNIEFVTKNTSITKQWLEENYTEEEPIQDLISRCEKETNRCRTTVLKNLQRFCDSAGILYRTKDSQDNNPGNGTVTLDFLEKELDHKTKIKDYLDVHMKNQFIFDNKLRLRMGLSIRQWEEVKQDTDMQNWCLTYKKGPHDRKITLWGTPQNINKIKNNPKLGIHVYE